MCWALLPDGLAVEGFEQLEEAFELDGLGDEVILGAAAGPGVGAHEGDLRPPTITRCQLIRQFLTAGAKKAHLAEDKAWLVALHQVGGVFGGRACNTGEAGAFHGQAQDAPYSRIRVNYQDGNLPVPRGGPG